MGEVCGVCCAQSQGTNTNSSNDHPYYEGMASLGTKNPLVKPATLDMIGERRNAIFGKAQMIKMSRATQVWLRARLINST